MTIYHSAYLAYQLTKRHSLHDSEKLASVLADAQVDLNPHQLDAALFAFQTFTIPDTESLGPAIPTGAYTLARAVEGAHRYRLGHPLALVLIERAKGRALPQARVTFDYTAWPQKAASLEPLVGQGGVLRLTLLAISGADAQDHLLLCAMTDTGATITEEAARRFFDLPSTVQPVAEAVKNTDRLETEILNRKQTILAELAQKQAQWFDEEIDKLNHWAEDKRRGLKADLKDYDDQIGELKKSARLAVNLPEKLSAQKKIRDLDAKRNAAWKEYDEGAKAIEGQKDTLLDSVEARLRQTITEKTIFTIAWSVT